MQTDVALTMGMEAERLKDQSLELYFKIQEEDLLEVVGFLTVIEGYFKSKIA